MTKIVYFDFQKKQRTGDSSPLVAPVNKEQLLLTDEERRERSRKRLLEAAKRLGW